MSELTTPVAAREEETPGICETISSVQVLTKCEEAEENETVAPAGAEDSEAASENGTRHAGDHVEELE